MFGTQVISICSHFISQQVTASVDPVATVQTPDSHVKDLNGR